LILYQILSRSRRTAAILDVLEAVSGLALALFLWMHMVFVATIFLGAEAFDGIAHALDAYYLSFTGIPPLIVVFFLHFLLAARKIPFAYREQRVIWRHAGLLAHRDTWTWLFQAVSGMAILLLGSIHFWVVLSAWPIGASLSIHRVGQWPQFVFYIALLFLGEMHAGIGLYRLAVKWGWPPRRRAGIFFEIISLCVIGLGLTTLVIFRRLGGGP
jgi:fumarate reductase subunit C